MFFRGVAFLVAVQWAFIQDAPIRETYPDGQLKAEYRLDTDGRRHGAYSEFFQNRKKKQTGTYFHGVLDGTWEDFCDTGRIRVRRRYDRGSIKEVRGFEEGGAPPYQVLVAPSGPLLTVPGGKGPESLFKRKMADITAKLAEIEGPGFDGEKVAAAPGLTAPHKAGKLDGGYLSDAARHVAAYRWLCGLSTDVEIDPARSESCQHACVLLAALDDGLSHTPRKAPGMSEPFFKKAAEGAIKSNLHQGQASLRQAVDGFMDDSDPTNIEHVGHRMWILAPGLKKTGFGQAEGFVAMWVTEQPGSATATDMLRYPAPGYFPAGYLKARAAWNCRMIEGKYQFAKDLAVRAWALDEDYAPRAELTVTNAHVNKGNVIFRPTLDDELKGQRVLIQIQGVKQGKTDVPIMYVVEFFA